MHEAFFISFALFKVSVSRHQESQKPHRMGKKRQLRCGQETLELCPDEGYRGWTWGRDLGQHIFRQDRVAIPPFSFTVLDQWLCHFWPFSCSISLSLDIVESWEDNLGKYMRARICRRIKAFRGCKSPPSPRLLPESSPNPSYLEKVGRTWGESGKTKHIWKETWMKKINYKGRCEKRKVSKCKDG